MRCEATWGVLLAIAEVIHTRLSSRPSDAWRRASRDPCTTALSNPGGMDPGSPEAHASLAGVARNDSRGGAADTDLARQKKWASVPSGIARPSLVFGSVQVAWSRAPTLAKVCLDFSSSRSRPFRAWPRRYRIPRMIELSAAQRERLPGKIGLCLTP